MSTKILQHEIKIASIEDALIAINRQIEELGPEVNYPYTVIASGYSPTSEEAAQATLATVQLVAITEKKRLERILAEQKKMYQCGLHGHDLRRKYFDHSHSDNGMITVSCKNCTYSEESPITENDLFINLGMESVFLNDWKSERDLIASFSKEEISDCYHILVANYVYDKGCDASAFVLYIGKDGQLYTVEGSSCTCCNEDLAIDWNPNLTNVIELRNRICLGLFGWAPSNCIIEILTALMDYEDYRELCIKYNIRDFKKDENLAINSQKDYEQ